MPYILEGRSIPLDAPFTATNAEGEQLQFPANWIRLSTEEDRAAIGMSWQEDPKPWDQRWQWGWTEDGQPIWKDHGQLVEQWTAQTRTTAGTLLTPSDWMVIREQDNGVAVPAEWRTWRETVRLAAGSKVYEIQQTTTTEQLANYLMSSAYTSWPADPNAPAPAPVEDATEEPVVFASNSTSAGIG